MRPNIWIGLASTVATVAAAGLYRSYRREISEACDALVANGNLICTGAGQIEYSREGEGEPALVIHGAGGGYDQGLALGRGLLVGGYDIIAPSRFGYSRTPVLVDGSSAAQADAHAALLDTLNVDRAVVVGVSAGAPSAIEMAVRHPSRVEALILIVPRAYCPRNSVGPERSAPSQTILNLLESGSDFAFWLAIRFARSAVVRFLGVPPNLEAAASKSERERVSRLMRDILPLSKRMAGLRNDALTEIVEPFELERINVPTLVISAEDDLMGTLPAARFTAEHIKGAELMVLESGGHLMVGRGLEVAKRIRKFLSRCAASEYRAAA